MTRLQHYVELVYLVVAALAVVGAWEDWNRPQWRRRPAWQELLILAATIVMAPLMLVGMTCAYVRNAFAGTAGMED